MPHCVVDLDSPHCFSDEEGSTLIKTDDLLRNGSNTFGVKSAKVIHRVSPTFVGAYFLKCHYYAKADYSPTIFYLLFTKQYINAESESNVQAILVHVLQLNCKINRFSPPVLCK